MDAALFTKMLSDKSILDLRKLSYKFPKADIREFVELLKNGFYHSLPLKDFSGQNPCLPAKHCTGASLCGQGAFNTAKQHMHLWCQSHGRRNHFYFHNRASRLYP